MSITIKFKVDEVLKEYILSESLFHNLDIEKIVLGIIEKDYKQRNVHLDKGYYVCNSELFDKEHNKVFLTKMERNVFFYLLKFQGSIVNIEDIESNVWRRKRFSVYSLRNIIMSIRKKTYMTIIKSNQKKGYYVY